MKTLIKTQFYLLLLGTLFAWSNFAYELKAWLENKANPLGCVPGINNPFLTPCFYGAIFFSLAFMISVLLLKKSNSK